MSAASNHPGRLSLGQILERLEELEAKCRTTTNPSQAASSLPARPIDLRDEPKPKPVDERHGPEHHRPTKKETAPTPERPPTLRTMAKEMAASAPAPAASASASASAAPRLMPEADVESTIVPERPIAAPPTVPKLPIGVAEDGRYGRSESTPTPKVEKPSATKINLTEFEARPKPVDISVEPEDAVIVQPGLMPSKKFDFRQFVMITLYVAIVLFVVAAAIYFR